MSGGSYHFGDSVTLHGGFGNTGIVKRDGAVADVPTVSPALRAAVQELLRLVEDLRDGLPLSSVQALDDSLPAVTADATVPPEDRHRALMAVAGIAATVGTIGRPVLDAVNHILQLLGAQ